MQCQGGHRDHRDQEDGTAPGKRKGNGNRGGGGLLVKVLVGLGVLRRLGLAGRFPRVFWGCLSHRTPGENCGTLTAPARADSGAPTGPAIVWVPTGISEDTSPCSPEPLFC